VTAPDYVDLAFAREQEQLEALEAYARAQIEAMHAPDDPDAAQALASALRRLRGAADSRNRAIALLDIQETP
jgi:hypothetical protein